MSRTIEKHEVMSANKMNAGIELLNMMAIVKIVDGIPTDELERIAKAYKDGRCIILPCKVGDTVWVLSDGKAVECVMDDAMRFKAVKYNLEIKRHFNGKIGEQQTVFLTRESAEAALKGEKG